MNKNEKPFWSKKPEEILKELRSSSKELTGKGLKRDLFLFAYLKSYFMF